MQNDYLQSKATSHALLLQPIKTPDDKTEDGSPECNDFDITETTSDRTTDEIITENTSADGNYSEEQVTSEVIHKKHATFSVNDRTKH